MRYFIQSYERQNKIIFPECTRLAGTRIDKTISILDLKNVSTFKLLTGDIKAILQGIIKISQDNYPESLYKMFIINSGFMFSAVWTVVKPFLDEKTQKKIVIISGNGLKEIREEIDL